MWGKKTKELWEEGVRQHLQVPNDMSVGYKKKQTSAVSSYDEQEKQNETDINILLIFY